MISWITKVHFPMSFIASDALLQVILSPLFWSPRTLSLIKQVHNIRSYLMTFCLILTPLKEVDMPGMHESGELITFVAESVYTLR
ncbi:hypothetical protein F5B17DRAFT_186554 [Nemania serpens]|nr:hypothetical protein F5B17DRAFT_186554 [Nemania serpens]